jgi:hypothetical protein
MLMFTPFALWVTAKSKEVAREAIRSFELTG